MGIPYEVGHPLTCAQMRALDEFTITQIGIPGIVLMENAGRAAAEFIYAALLDPSTARVLILCGAGNNGGDGFVVARHLHNAGVPVVVALAAPPDRARGDAAINLRIIQQMRLKCLPAYEPDGLAAARAEAEQAEIIVDALLGTGSQGPPRGVAAELVHLANAAPRARRVAIDIPSGLDGDSGTAHEPCFRAHATVTMAALKTGLAAAAGREFTGRVVVVDIGVPREQLPRSGNSGQTP